MVNKSLSLPCFTDTGPHNKNRIWTPGPGVQSLRAIPMPFVPLPSATLALLRSISSLGHLHSLSLLPGTATPFVLWLPSLGSLKFSRPITRSPLTPTPPLPLTLPDFVFFIISGWSLPLLLLISALSLLPPESKLHEIRSLFVLLYSQGLYPGPLRRENKATVPHSNSPISRSTER